MYMSILYIFFKTRYIMYMYSNNLLTWLQSWFRGLKSLFKKSQNSAHVYLSICSFICLSVHSSIFISVHLSLHLSHHQSKKKAKTIKFFFYFSVYHPLFISPGPRCLQAYVNAIKIVHPSICRLVYLIACTTSC